MGKMLGRKGFSSIHKCAFCEYFYDPTQEVITPKKGSSETWEYVTNAEKLCRLKGMNVVAKGSCQKFKCRV